MLTRRTAVGALVSSGVARSQKSARRPNFLFLIADDHAGYVLGANGNKQAETPNLDKLARQGTIFSNHHCNQPVCTPSRQSLLTGQMPSAAGVTVLRTPLDERKPTLAKQFGKAGYRTAVFGKMHFNTPSKPGLHGFDYAACEDAIGKEWAALGGGARPVPPEIRTKPVWRPFKDPARIWLNADKYPFPRYEEDMRSAHTVRQACKYLDEHKDKQFALWVSLTEPHSPFDFPVEDRYWADPRRFDPPKVGKGDGWQIPLIFSDLSNEQKAGIIAAYYTSVRYLDRSMGKVLAHLSKLGLDDNTCVVYLADHGYCLGHHGRFEKHCGYAPALHVPLIVRWPGRVRENHRVTDMTEHIDVPATICDLMGVDALPVLHGQSLRPYLDGRRVSKPRDHVVAQYLENEEAYVRTAKWKYIYGSGKRKRTDGYETENPTPGRYRRLFDLSADAGEFADVAGQHAKVVQELEERWIRRMRATHPDAGQEPGGASREELMDFYLRPRDA